MGGRKTLKDVTKEAGFSVAIVSRVLGNYGYFSEETKYKVLGAVDKLDYKPDAIARGLKIRKTKVIRVVISDVLSFYFTQ